MKSATVALVFLLVGCAPWTHPTKNEDDFRRDWYECTRDAAPVQDAIRALDMKGQCMRLRGWRQ